LVIIFGMKKTMKKNKGLTIFISLVVIFVVTVIVIGFILIGSPAQQRFERLDAQRSNNLSLIDSELIDYWTIEQTLPESLDMLEERIYNEDNLKDPETNNYYAYSKNSDNTFTLCANFALENTEQRSYAKPRNAYVERSGSYYEHGAGEVCYEVELDRERYNSFVNGELPSLSNDFPVRAY